MLLTLGMHAQWGFQYSVCVCNVYECVCPLLRSVVFRLRAHDKKKKKVVGKRKKDPFSIKPTLKRLEEIVVERQSMSHNVASRIAGKGSPAVGRTSPLLYHQPNKSSSVEPN